MSWEEVKQAIAVPIKDERMLYYICRKANELLHPNAKHLETIFGYGKKLLEAEEHITAGRKYNKKSANNLKRSGEIYAATNMDELTADQKVELLDEARKWSSMELLHKELLRKKPGEVTSGIETHKIAFDLVKHLTGK